MQRIYLHGLGQTPASWQKTVTQLGSAGQGICPDLAGMLRGRDASYQNLYAAFSEICGRTGEALDLCGLSLGGVLALNYAVDYPEKVHSLVLVGAQYKMPKGTLRLQNMLFRFMPESMFEQTGFGKPEFLRLCKTMMELDFSGSLHKIVCPVLVIYGEKDAANKKAAAELAGMLANAALQVIPGSGHEVNQDAPEKLAEILSVFYRRIG